MTSKQMLRILQKSSLLLFLVILVGCASPLQETIQKTEEIDEDYSVKLSDYEHGLTHFNGFIRNESLNPPVLKKYCGELESLKSNTKNERARKYLDFRINLCKAEKVYKESVRPSTEGYRSPYIKCSEEEQFRESFKETEKAIDFTREAMEDYEGIKEEVNINSSWVSNTKESNQNISSGIEEKRDMFAKFCNSTQSE